MTNEEMPVTSMDRSHSATLAMAAAAGVAFATMLATLFMLGFLGLEIWDVLSGKIIG